MTTEIPTSSYQMARCGCYLEDCGVVIFVKCTAHEDEHEKGGAHAAIAAKFWPPTCSCVGCDALRATVTTWAAALSSDLWEAM